MKVTEEQKRSAQKVNFCKATAQWKCEDYEDVLSQACNFPEVKVLQTTKNAFVRAFGNPQKLSTPSGALYVWDTSALKIFLMDCSTYRLVHFEVPSKI